MIQKRVLAVYFSIIRRKAICATDVIASASSRTISLKPPIEGESLAFGAAENICLVPFQLSASAKVAIQYDSTAYWQMS